MTGVSNKAAAVAVGDLIAVIQENKAYLSEIDGAIGDGDHGVNMNKGFTMCKERVNLAEVDLSGAMKGLGRILLMEIGGSMGPIYGTFFIEMSKVIKDKETIEPADFSKMLAAALAGIQSMGNAQKGDKTLLDTLIPAREAFDAALAAGKTFSQALADMSAAAKTGWEGTKDMVAKIGRASRLGERSRGTLDAGATSCYLILKTLADSFTKLLA